MSQLSVFDSAMNAGTSGHGKNLISRVERIILRNLFEINHVLLTNQAVTTLVFHIIMAFEFAQILFHVFYRMDVVNEFASPINSNSSILLNNLTILKGYEGITPLLNTTSLSN